METTHFNTNCDILCSLLKSIFLYPQESYLLHLYPQESLLGVPIEISIPLHYGIIMEDKAFRGTLDEIRKRYSKEINNLWIFVEFAKKSLEMSIVEVEKKKKGRFAFVIPSKVNREISIPRTKSSILKVLRKAKERELHSYALIALVAVFESFCREILLKMFLHDPRRLLSSKTGSKSDKQVSLESIIESSSREDVLQEAALKRTGEIFYHPPEAIFSEIEGILDIELPEDIKRDVKETKATRDLLVHNEGVVNRIYLKKAGEQSRAVFGEEIPVDYDYFYQSVAVIKHFIKDAIRHLKKQHRSKVEA